MLINANRSRFLALCCAGFFSVAAQAQWAWKEDNGRVVYSDRPPPASVKQDRIVRQPGGVPTGGGSGGEAAGETKTDAAAAPKTWADREAEYKKRQAERAEAEKKGDEEKTQKAQRRADCERARSYLATLESGTRIVQSDAKGEKSYLDDAQRAAEVTRAREIMSRSCN